MIAIYRNLIVKVSRDKMLAAVMSCTFFGKSERPKYYSKRSSIEARRVRKLSKLCSPISPFAFRRTYVFQQITINMEQIAF